MNTKMAGFRWFSKIVRPCALDERSPKGKGKPLALEWLINGITGHSARAAIPSSGGLLHD